MMGHWYYVCLLTKKNIILCLNRKHFRLEDLKVFWCWFPAVTRLWLHNIREVKKRHRLEVQNRIRTAFQSTHFDGTNYVFLVNVIDMYSINIFSTYLLSPHPHFVIIVHNPVAITFPSKNMLVNAIYLYRNITFRREEWRLLYTSVLSHFNVNKQYVISANTASLFCVGLVLDLQH